MTSPLVVIGTELRRVRLKRNLTLAEVAAGSGTALSAIHYYEYGKKEPGALSLFALADFLEVDLDALARRVRRSQAKRRPSRAS